MIDILIMVQPFSLLKVCWPNPIKNLNHKWHKQKLVVPGALISSHNYHEPLHLIFIGWNEMLPLMNRDSEEIKHLTHEHIQLFVYIISWDKHLQWSLWLFYKSLLFSIYKQMANQLVINKIYINIYHPFLLFLLDHFSARVCKTTLNLVLYVCVCVCVNVCLYVLMCLWVSLQI